MVDLKKMRSEMDEMTKALEEPGIGEEELRTDPPGTSAPPTTAPKTEAPGTDPPGTSAPETKAPVTKAPTTDAPVEDERDKVIRELREKLAERVPAPKTKAPKTAAPKTDVPISDEDFLADTDLDDLTRDPKLFNQLLNKIYKKGVVFARSEMRKSTEGTIRAIPDIVKNNIALTTRLKKVHDEFYAENKDLVPWKTAVGAVFEEALSASPDKTYEELLPEVAKEVRKRLALQQSAQPPKGKDNPPNLPRKKGGQRQTLKPDTDLFQREMDEMDKGLGID